MTHLVGARVAIPGDQWEPKEEGLTYGSVSKGYAPTSRYPLGRIEVCMDADGWKFIFPLDKFPETWITSMPEVGKKSFKATKTPSTAKKTSGDVSEPGPRLNSPRRARGKAADSEDLKSAQQDKPSSPNTSATPEHGGGGIPHRRVARKSAAGSDAAPAAMKAGRSKDASPPPRQPSRGASPPRPPGTTVPRLSPLQTGMNAALLVLVAIPALLYGAALSNGWGGPQGTPEAAALAAGPTQLFSPAWWLAVGNHRPLLAANLVFFFNVDVLFWVLSLLQGSTWLIDPYWTMIPVMVGFFYQSHPQASADPTRSFVSMALLCIWSARLTHSYFRREEWQLGAREDWRFTDMKSMIGRHWPWLSFFAAYLSQHVMLMGITWPLYTIHSVSEPWHPLWDTLAAAAAASGIIIAYIADTQLQAFMVQNEHLKSLGLEGILINQKGLWRYSRHPNYFGELLWWWGLAFFALRLGHPVVMAGATFNTLAMIPVTFMVEARMMRKPERVEAFRRYCTTTSVWVPWPRR